MRILIEFLIRQTCFTYVEMSVGVAGEDAPRVCIRSRMAYPQGQDPLHEGTPKWVEDQEKNQKNGEILYEQVIDRGIPLDWLLLEQIWTQTFLNNDLGMAKPKEHLVLVTEPLRQPHATRIRVAEIMMKTFEFSGMYFCKQPVLALFGTGRTSGCVLESGHHLTYAVPIVDGYVVDHAVREVPVAGKHILHYLMQLYYDKCETKAFSTSEQEEEFFRDIKESFCYVSLDWREEVNRNTSRIERWYEHADGNVSVFGEERIRCPEILFDPSLWKEEYEHHKGLSDCCYEAIKSCGDDSTQALMFENICLTGGNTLFPGMRERVQHDVSRLVSASIRVQVTASEERKYSTWLGGSALAILEGFQPYWVSRDVFDVQGPSALDLTF